MFRFACALERLGGVLVALACLVGCGDRSSEKPLQYAREAPPAAQPTYKLIPHPLYNPARLVEVMQPLVDHLNRRVPDVHIELETSADYQAYEGKVRAGHGEILMPNPWQALEAMKQGYHVIAMWGAAEDFKGIFIVRRDGNIKTPQDLVGKTVSYPSPTALAAAIMPQYWLHSKGIDVNKDIRNIYVGSQESSIMNAYLGTAAAGATWPPPWRLFAKLHPEEASQLRVAWETPALINNAVMVRGDVPGPRVEALRKALLGLAGTEEGRRILARLETAGFFPATDATYAVVRDYVQRFERDVRPVELK